MLPDSTRVGCPLVTPFDGDDVDADAMAAVVEHVVGAGVDALVPCGTTGEFASLTAAERRLAVETTVGAAPADVPVVAGCSATATGDVRQHLRDAADAGADAALVLPPYYLTADEPAGNRRFLEAALDGAPLPVYLYNIPAYVGAALAPETVAALAERAAVVGMKDSSGDLAYLDDVLGATPPDFQLFQGADGTLVPSVYLGATGGVNALSHLVPGAMLAAVEAVRDGEHARARRLQRAAVGPLARRCAAHGFAPTVKAALAADGVIPSAAVRPPLIPPGSDALADIEAAVAAAREAAG